MRRFGVPVIIAGLSILALLFFYNIVDFSVERDDLMESIKQKKQTIEIIGKLTLYAASCKDDCNISSLETYLSMSAAKNDGTANFGWVTVTFRNNTITSVEVIN